MGAAQLMGRQTMGLLPQEEVQSDILRLYRQIVGMARIAGAVGKSASSNSIPSARQQPRIGRLQKRAR